MTTPDTDPSEIPEEIATALEGSSDSQLRAVVHYAQRLLRERQAATDAIEPREGERLVRTEDHGAYTLVVVERTDESVDDGGRFAYRVKRRPDFGEGSGEYQWQYLGKVDAESEGE